MLILDLCDRWHCTPSQLFQGEDAEWVDLAFFYYWKKDLKQQEQVEKDRKGLK